MKIALLLVLLSGCAIQGVKISDEERLACKLNECTVWNQTQLTNFANHFFRQGYAAGFKAGKDSL